jgi:hemerythrin-like domain-containing protein
MLLYVNGCSHTEGHHLEQKYTWSNLVKESLGVSYNLINDAKCGAGNDYILHQSLESISKLINENKKPNLVIIQWSSPYRRLHSTHIGVEKFVNTFDNSEYGVKFEPMASKHTLHYIYLLQQFLKDNNIP